MIENVPKKWGRFLIVFVSSVSMCFLIGATLINNKQQMERLQMERLVLTKTNKLNEVLSRLLYKTQILGVLVVQNEGDIDNFERLAATIVDDPAIKNIIIAPGGVVSHVYPIAGNEKVIGLDYFSQGEGNKEAILARDTGQLILGGPFNLVQGGQALVGRLPVYIEGTNKEKEFWGIVSVTLEYPLALEGADLVELENQGFGYELWRISPDTGERQTIASGSYNFDREVEFVERPVKIFNAQWHFRIAPIREWYEYAESWIAIFMGLFISFLLAYLVQNNYDLNEMRHKLEQLSEKDALTGVLNRRGLFRILENRIREDGRPFILCYIDLDKFKETNDLFGHGAGDGVLEHFVKVLQSHIRDKGLIARIGGDEFIVIFENTDRRAEAEEVFRKIDQELKEPVYVGGKNQVQISYSVGTAVYPSDGKTVAELMASADQAMYSIKREEN